MAVNDAEQIFVNLPTVDDPHKKVTLQDAIALLVCEVLDMKTQIGELEKWAQLTDELATAVRRMQTTFDTLAKQLSGTNAVAKALMNGRTAPRGVN